MKNQLREDYRYINRYNMPFGTDSALRHKLPTTNEHIIGNHRWRRLLEVLDKLAEDVAIAYVR